MQGGFLRCQKLQCCYMARIYEVHLLTPLYLSPSLAEHTVAFVQRRRRTKEEMRLREWKQTELKALEEQLLLFGEGNTEKIRSLVRIRSIR